MKKISAIKKHRARKVFCCCYHKEKNFFPFKNFHEFTAITIQSLRKKG